MRSYTYRYSKLKKSCTEGVDVRPDGEIAASPFNGSHSIILWPIDGGETKALWGRLHIEVLLQGQAVFCVYAAAVDEPPDVTGHFLLDKSLTFEQKKEYFLEHGTKPFLNQEDMLLYSLKGRYLWLGFELSLEAAGSIKRIQVINPGDHFLQTFPEVYQERDSVFHRYLSIFSTMYSDFENEAEKLCELFMPDRAPVWMLPYLGGLIGIDTGRGLLDDKTLREFLEHAFDYIRMKGTGRVLREITKLLMKEEPFLIEKEDGNVIFLLNHRLCEQEELKLLFFLKQFMPVYVRLNLISYEEENGMDRYCFADINAKLLVLPKGGLDLEFASEQCIMQ